MTDALDAAIEGAPEATGSVTPHEGGFTFEDVLKTIQEGSKKVSLECQPVSIVFEKVEVKQKPGKQPCAHISAVVSGAKFPVNEKGKDIIGVKEMFFLTIDPSSFGSALNIKNFETMWAENGHTDGLFPNYDKLAGVEFNDIIVNYSTPDNPEDRPFASLRMAREYER